MEQHSIRVIGRIETDFPDKFGIPRQSSLVESLRGRIVLEPEYRVMEAFRGLEQYDRIWLLWQFSLAVREHWKPTVRPPRLGGNERVGVFATRSPYRPNSIGLSCVKLERVEQDSLLGPVLWVRGADLVNGTPIYDIKPYLPYADSFPDARGGFGEAHKDDILTVEISDSLLLSVPEAKREALCDVLAHDPRPAYQEDPERIYGLSFAGLNIKFQVCGRTLTVIKILPASIEE